MMESTGRSCTTPMVQVPVIRQRSSLARAVSCSYRTEDGTGIAGIDYEEATGTLEFADQEAPQLV